MIDKKDMLVKVASYDKATCVLANTVIAYKEMMAKKAAYDNLPVGRSNALQGALADQIVEGPRTLATIGGGAGIGLLAGLLLGAAKPVQQRSFNNPWAPTRGQNIAAGGTAGAVLGANAASVYELIRRTIKGKKDVQKYRAAEAKQNNVPDETSEDKEKKEKETKTASVKEVVNGLLSKYINK